MNSAEAAGEGASEPATRAAGGGRPASDLQCDLGPCRPEEYQGLDSLLARAKSRATTGLLTEQQPNKERCCGSGNQPGAPAAFGRRHGEGLARRPTHELFDAITASMAKVFRVPLCHINLFCGDQLWFRSNMGPQASGCANFSGTWCRYISVPTKPEVVIVENAMEDSRFRTSPYCAGEPYIRFYAGAPLVGSGGQRYGSLCVIDFVPRSFKAAPYHMLVNSAEIVVQELERNRDGLSSLRQQSAAAIKESASLAACISNATGVAMIDTRRPDWTFMFGNATFCAASCRNIYDLLASGFWDIFEPTGQGLSRSSSLLVPAMGLPVTSPYVVKATGQRVWLTLKPACSDQLAPGKPVGVPSWVLSETWPTGVTVGSVADDEVCRSDPAACKGIAKCFYFVVVLPTTSRSMTLHSSHTAGIKASSSGTALDRVASTSKASVVTRRGQPGMVASTSISSSGSGDPSTGHSSLCCYGDYDLPPDLASSLTMGELIGSGSFSKVYRGMWRETPVAVKVVVSSPEAAINQAETEAITGMLLEHPSVVKTLKCQRQTLSEFADVDQRRTVVWILQEYCNCGTLYDAVERGKLQLGRDPASLPDMAKLYKTILEVAEGMAYIHSHGLVHCNLNGRNVVLKASRKTTRGFTAKVCDFGLATVSGGKDSESRPETFGTLSHMAPETLIEGRVCFKSDVWSFGVMLWEVYTRTRAYTGKTPANIMYLANARKCHLELELPASAPAYYKAIMKSCLSYSTEERPSFSEIVSMVKRAYEDSKQSYGN